MASEGALEREREGLGFVWAMGLGCVWIAWEDGLVMSDVACVFCVGMHFATPCFWVLLDMRVCIPLCERRERL